VKRGWLVDATRTRSANCWAVSSSSSRAGGKKYTSHTTAQLVISLNCGVGTQARVAHACSEHVCGEILALAIEVA